LTATHPSFLYLPLLACHEQSIASNTHNNRVIAKKTKYRSGRRPKKRTPDTVSTILDTKAIDGNNGYVQNLDIATTHTSGKNLNVDRKGREGNNKRD
jgi:hypothetical protein